MDILAFDFMQFNEAENKFRYLLKNPELVRSMWRTFFVALIVGMISSLSAMALAFLSTRIAFRRLEWLKGLAYTAYLTPPVILVLSLDWLSQFAVDRISALFVVILGQSAFLFPLNYGLAVGHWLQSEWAFDRNASIDGASLWRRYFIHFAPGTSTYTFCAGLGLLSFMLAWSDVLFSRFLLINKRESRLLTDLVIDYLSQSDITEPRGELAAVAFLTIIVAGTAAAAYSVMFERTSRR